MSIINNFSKNFKSLRLSNNMTQDQLAEILGTKKQTISSYELGKRLPDLYSIIKISICFKCSIDSLVFDNTEINPTGLNNANKINQVTINELEDIHRNLSKKISEFNSLEKKLDKTLISLKENLNNSSNLKNEFSNELTFSIENNPKSILKPVDTYKNIINITNIKSSGTVGVSFCGNISAGCPRPTFSDLNDIFYIPSHLIENNQEYFILRINGESMNKIYQHNDYVLVKKYNHITNCFKVPFVVSVDGSESTVKFIDIDTNSHTFSLVPYSTDELFKVQTYSFDKHKLEILGSIECIINIKED